MGAADEISPPPLPAMVVDGLIEQIQMAATLEFLETLRPEMRRVPKGPDRDRVVAAVQRRAEEIRAEQAPSSALALAEEGAL
jgi:hypothetical protein